MLLGVESRASGCTYLVNTYMTKETTWVLQPSSPWSQVSVKALPSPEESTEHLPHTQENTEYYPVLYNKRKTYR